MIFNETPLKGAYVIDIEKNEDSRGFFARTWCEREFKDHNLSVQSAQFSISFNSKKGTLRGMHFQIPPYEEVKIVRCTMGAIYDVIIDIRKSSPTYKKYFGIELSAQNRKMFYIPEGFAHGFITLEDNTEIFYQISNFYEPQAARSIKWDDPEFHIEWPMKPVVISERDKNIPAFNENVLK